MTQAPGGWRWIERALCWASCLLVLALAAGCRSKPAEKPLTPAQQLEKKRKKEQDYWSHQPLIPSRRFRDPPPPKKAMVVELSGQSLFVDYDEVGSTLAHKGGSIDESQQEFELRYVYRHLLKQVRVHPRRRAVELWVGPTVTGAEFARTLVTLKRGGVEDIHVAVQDAQSEARGWILVRDFRGYTYYNFGVKPTGFEVEELMPWKTLGPRLPQLVTLCKKAGRTECYPPAKSEYQGGVMPILVDLLGYELWIAPEPSKDLGSLAYDAEQKAAFLAALHEISRGGRWPFAFYGPPELWGLGVGEMYPDGTELPPMGYPLDLTLGLP